LRSLQRKLRLRPSALADGLTNLLRESGAHYARILSNPGVDFISLNTKLRQYPGEDFTRLVVTDISPSVVRIAERSYRSV
jgi:hypothetical protein